MDTAVRTLLQGVSRSPVASCSCAKGIAAGLRIVQHCLAGPGSVGRLPAEAFGGLLPSSQVARQVGAAGAAHSGSGSGWGSGRSMQEQTLPAERPMVVTTRRAAPDTERASSGLAGAHEEQFLARLMAGMPE